MRASGFSRFFIGSVAAAAMVAGLAACEGRVAARGHLPDPERLAEITPGETGKDEVSEILGSPSSVSPFEGESWYYISEQQRRVAFFEPEIQERQIVIIRFDEQGVVKAIDDMGLEAAEEIEPVDRTTPTLGREYTLIEQLLGNFNRYRSKTRKAPDSGAGPRSPAPGGY